MVLSHNDLNVTTVASSGGSMGDGEGDRPPPQSESGLLRVFLVTSFPQLVVIFLFQGLRSSSPITNLSPQDC